MKLLHCIIYVVCISNLTIQIRLAATATRQDMQTLRGNIKLLLATEQYQAAKQILLNDAQKGPKRILPLSDYNQLMAQTLTNIRTQGQASAEENKQLLDNYKIYHTTATDTFKTAKLGEFSTKNIDTVTQWFTKAYKTYKKDDTLAQTITELKKNIIAHITKEQNIAKKVEKLTQEKEKLTQKAFTVLLNDIASYTHRLAYLHILPTIIPNIKKEYNIDFTTGVLTYQEEHIKKNAIKLITEKIKDFKQLQKLFADIKKFTTPERVQTVIDDAKEKRTQAIKIRDEYKKELTNITTMVLKKQYNKISTKELQPIGDLLTAWHAHFKTNTFDTLKTAINNRIEGFKTKKQAAEDKLIEHTKQLERTQEKWQKALINWYGTKDNIWGTEAKLYAHQLTMQSYLDLNAVLQALKKHTTELSVPAIGPTSAKFTFDPTERRKTYIMEIIDRIIQKDMTDIFKLYTDPKIQKMLQEKKLTKQTPQVTTKVLLRELAKEVKEAKQ